MVFNISTILDHHQNIRNTKKLDKLKVKLHVFEYLKSVLLNSYNPFLHQTLTVNEKLIIHDNHKRSAHWFKKDEVSKHFPKLKLQEKKLNVWKSVIGIFYNHILGCNQRITAKTYCQEKSCEVFFMFKLNWQQLSTYGDQELFKEENSERQRAYEIRPCDS